MQEPTEDDDDEASISMENEEEDTNLNDTFVVRRKAAKRTLPWDLSVDELELMSPPQAEAIRATKRPRLEERSSASAEAAAAELPSHDTAVSLPAADVYVAADHADANSVKGTQGTVHWTPEEDAKLNSAVMNNSKLKDAVQRHGGKDWAAIAAFVPGRAKRQCRDRWKDALYPNIDLANERTGKWLEDENIKLKDTVETHDRKNWGAVAALVPERTNNQRCAKWNDHLDPSIDLTTARAGKWTAVDAGKLKDAVQTHDGKDWAAIAALVPGQAKRQCRDRWHNILATSIDPTTARTGKWSEDEEIKLKDAVQTHGGKDWAAIAVLVPGRTEMQCNNRWHNILATNIDPTTARTGKWSEDEDIKLKDAVQTRGGKNWDAIAALVPGRTKMQCRARWKEVLDPSIDRADGRTGKWSAEEEIKLKDAVRTHGGKNWAAIAALVPGRTKIQCWRRWRDFVDPSIDPTTAHTGKWTADEDIKLRNSVQMHGGKNWETIAMLVPGRTNRQCSYRWHDVLKSNIDQVTGRKSNWTAYEDIKLKDAVETLGSKNWVAVAALVPGRTRLQCRKRWHDVLDPSIDRANIRRGTWTAVEDLKLKDAVQTHGSKSWGEIAVLVPGRSEKQCWGRWNDTKAFFVLDGIEYRVARV
jgi:hypothetical protein